MNDLEELAITRFVHLRVKTCSVLTPLRFCDTFVAENRCRICTDNRGQAALLEITSAHHFLQVGKHYDVFFINV